MKALKITLGIVVLLAVVIAGAIMYGLSNLNGFVEKIIEETGSSMTQTQVSVGSVDIKITEGSGAINNLRIANPEGYSENALFSAQMIGLSLDTESILQNSPVKVIKQVSVGEITLNAEQKGIKDTNIQALLDNMKSTGSKDDSKKEEPASDVRIMIEKLTFAAATIDLQTEKLGGKAVKLPSFTLTNIGDKKTGLTPAQAGEVIAKRLLDKVKAAVKAELKNQLKDEAKAKLKEKLNEKVDEALKGKVSKESLRSLFN